MKIRSEAVELANAVSESRVWSRLMELAEIGRSGRTGVNRPAFSAEDREAKRLLMHWATKARATAYQDALGNLFLRYESPGCSGRSVVTGSHLDSQPSGGRFDGAYGVVAALEVLEALNETQAIVRRPVEAVAWSNEEGARFAPGAMGSQFFAGSLDIHSIKDIEDDAGIRLEDALLETIESLPEAELHDRAEMPDAYVEAHIEQGPVLENDRKDIGVVDGIQGCIWIEYTVRGQAAHAGTTPMHKRRDALREAVRLIQELERHCLASTPDCRFTVGRLIVEPGSPNTIPNEVRFTVDFRERDPNLFMHTRAHLLDRHEVGQCLVEPRVLFEHVPELFDTEIVATVESAATDLGFSVARLTSGAFHDALFISEICRTAMIFVPCTRGISHHPDEYSSPQQLAAGTKVLATVVHSLANN